MLDNSVLPVKSSATARTCACGSPTAPIARAVAGVAIPALAEKLGLVNEFEPAQGPPAQSIAFLRRNSATSGAIADDGVGQADAVVHVAAPTAQPVGDFCAEASRLLGSMARLRVIGGVVRPRTYYRRGHEQLRLRAPGRAAARTSHAQRLSDPDEQDGRRGGRRTGWSAIPTSCRATTTTAACRTKGTRSPRPPASRACFGEPTSAATEPAPEGTYDFVTYFECADADVPTFHQVCDALRDVAQEPGMEVRARGADVAWPPRRDVGRAVRAMSTAAARAHDRPSDPIAAVTHRDPYPYYAELVATRPVHRDEALGLWVACSAAAVTDVLGHPACLVRPPAEPVPGALLGSPAGDIFGRLVRMNDGRATRR